MGTETIQEEKPRLLETRWFKSDRVTFAGVGKVDAETGVIHDVIMCQVGEAKGHGIHLEQSFIEEGIAYANKHHKKIGMKSRFGHPAMSNDALGTEMGRFKNFRVVNDKMVADLHLLESSNLSPTHPGIKDWMLSMAGEDPSAIMCSIVFSIKSFYQRNEENEKFEIEWKSDGWDGQWVSKDKKNTFDPNDKIYVSLKELMFCDIVDEGAATESLLSAQFNSDKFAVVATEFLNENPKIDQFIKDNPQKLMEFLGQRFGIKLEEKVGFADRVKEIVKEFFGASGSPSTSGSPAGDPKKEKLGDGSEETEEGAREELDINETEEGMEFKRSIELLKKGELSAEELAEVLGEIEAFTGANERFTKAEVDAQVQEAVQAKEAELNKGAADKDAEIEQLRVKVAALEKKPAEEPKKPVKDGEEELHEQPQEDKFSTSVDRELAEMQKRAGVK